MVVEVEHFAAGCAALQPVVLQQTTASDDGLIRRLARPDAGADTNRAYALQWYVFAALTVILYVALNLKRTPIE